MSSITPISSSDSITFFPSSSKKTITESQLDENFYSYLKETALENPLKDNRSRHTHRSLNGRISLHRHARPLNERISLPRTHTHNTSRHPSHNSRNHRHYNNGYYRNDKQPLNKRSCVTINFKNDLYTQKRGIPQALELYCQKCNAFIMTYQKDGFGRLLRCYLDRIHFPHALKKLQERTFEVKAFPNLLCPKCSATIGTPMIYYPEDRPAYKLLKDSSYYVKVVNV